MQVWWRVCVDLDGQGHPIGYSWERHDGDDTLRVTTATPGPFDTPEEVFALALAEVPVQLPLFR